MGPADSRQPPSLQTVKKHGGETAAEGELGESARESGGEDEGLRVGGLDVMDARVQEAMIVL